MDVTVSKVWDSEPLGGQKLKVQWTVLGLPEVGHDEISKVVRSLHCSHYTSLCLAVSTSDQCSV